MIVPDQMRSGSPSFLVFMLLKYLLNWTEIGKVYADTLKLAKHIADGEQRELLII